MTNSKDFMSNFMNKLNNNEFETGLTKDERDFIKSIVDKINVVPSKTLDLKYLID